VPDWVQDELRLLTGLATKQMHFDEINCMPACVLKLTSAVDFD
jgi:hypothetical protein